MLNGVFVNLENDNLIISISYAKKREKNKIDFKEK